MSLMENYWTACTNVLDHIFIKNFVLFRASLAHTLTSPGLSPSPNHPSTDHENQTSF
jgi:hypothetical protein